MPSPPTKEKDLELWRAWKKSRSMSDLQALFKQVDGLIQKETNRWSGVLARDVLELEAARLAKQAFETYDPAKGTALSTHMTNYLQKLSRIVYEHQNAARLPEYQTLKINNFQRAHTVLEAELGRPPTPSEVAGHLSWSTAAVEKMHKMLRKESMESLSTALPASGRTSSEPSVDLIYHDLSPLQQSIFSMSTGYGGAEIKSGQQIMKSLGITQGQLSNEKRKIVGRVKSLG